MTPRRWYAVSVLGLVVTGGAAFFAASRAWETRTLRTEGLPSDVVSVTGADGLPIVGALSLVVLAGGLAVLATGGRVRRAVGVLVTLAATGSLVALVAGVGAVHDAFVDAVQESPAYVGTGGVPDPSYSPWMVVTGVCLLAATVLGVQVARLGHRWPTMSGRYDAPAARQESARRTTGRPEDATGSQLWAELDEGRDPTEQGD